MESLSFFTLKSITLVVLDCTQRYVAGLCILLESCTGCSSVHSWRQTMASAGQCDLLFKSCKCSNFFRMIAMKYLMYCIFEFVSKPGIKELCNNKASQLARTQSKYSVMTLTLWLRERRVHSNCSIDVPEWRSTDNKCSIRPFIFFRQCYKGLLHYFFLGALF